LRCCCHCFELLTIRFFLFLCCSMIYAIGATLRSRTTPQQPERQSRSKRQRTGESSSPKTSILPPASKKKKVTMPSQVLLQERKRQPPTTKSNSAGKASSSPGQKAAAAIWIGAPDEKLDGGWPKGWRKEIYSRARGPRTDRYWYSPKLQCKLRSMVEVKKFLSALMECSGDEQAAFQIARNK
jgi:hypothetical protein